MTLRPARPEDAAALTALIKAAYASDAARIEGLPPVAEGVAEDIAQRLTMVAGDDAPIGVIIAEAAPDAFLILNLAVSPEATGKGLGARLIGWAEAEAKARALPRLRLHTHAEMTRALALYARLGWEETNREGVRVTLEKPVADS